MTSAAKPKMDSSDDEDQKAERAELRREAEYADPSMPGGFTPKVQSLLEAHQAELARKLEENKKRAARFECEVVAPKAETAVPIPNISAKELKRALAASKQAGFGAGINPFSEEEQARRAARVEKFGAAAVEASPFDLDPAAEEEAREKREAAARRAARFEVAVFADEALATKVRRAVGPGSNYYRAKGVAVKAASERRDALFICGFNAADNSLMPLGTECIVAYFQALGTRVAWVEWMGDGACNVVFEDSTGDSAPVVQRVVEKIGLPVPAVDGITAGEEPEEVAAEAVPTSGGEPMEGDEMQMEGEGAAAAAAAAAASPPAGPHWAARWRCVRAPITKTKTDKYGARGAAVEFLMRLATTADLRPAAFNAKKRAPAKRKRKKRKRGGDDHVVVRVSEHGRPLPRVEVDEGSGGGRGRPRTMPAMEMDDGERERRRRRIERFGGAPRASVFDRLGGAAAAAAPAPVVPVAAAVAPAAVAPAAVAPAAVAPAAVAP